MLKKNYIKANDKNVGCFKVYGVVNSSNIRLYEDEDHTKLIKDINEIVRLIEAGLLMLVVPSAATSNAPNVCIRVIGYTISAAGALTIQTSTSYTVIVTEEASES